MRILFVTPYPPSRIRVRSYGFLSCLQQNHEITIVTLCTSPRERASVKVLQSQGYRVEIVEEPRWQRVLRCGLALFSSIPLQVAYANSKHFTQVVQGLCKEDSFDVIHVEHLRGIATMHTIAQQYPLVWDAVDCIGLLCKQTMKSGVHPLVRATAWLDYKRTQHYETQLLNLLQQVVITSEYDRQAMVEFEHTQRDGSGRENKGQGATISVIPNGVDLSYFHPLWKEGKSWDLVFSGKMSYHANIAAAMYLCKQVMPLIWKHRPETTFTIVGSSPPKSIQRLTTDSRIVVTGYVDDIRPYIGSAAVVVAPMVYSVGIQNKVLEAMALGTPVIATSQVVAALHARPGHDLLVADSAQDFANATLQLLDKPEARRIFGQNGRAYVEQYHDWSVMTQQLTNVYQQAIISHRVQDSTLEPVGLRVEYSQ